MTLGVLATRTVTLLTNDTRHKASLAVTIVGRRERLKVTCVTLKTTSNDGTAKIRDPVPVPGAVDPLPQLPPVRNGQLKELDRKSTRLNSSHGYISYAV